MHPVGLGGTPLCAITIQRQFLKQRRQPDLELASGEAVDGDVAVLLGEDIGEARGEAVIVEASVEQGKASIRASSLRVLPKAGSMAS